MSKSLLIRRVLAYTDDQSGFEFAGPNMSPLISLEAAQKVLNRALQHWPGEKPLMSDELHSGALKEQSIETLLPQKGRVLEDSVKSKSRKKLAIWSRVDEQSRYVGCRVFRSPKLRFMQGTGLGALVLFVLACTNLCLEVQGAEAPLSPHVTSVFPLGGQRGTQVEVGVRGMALDGVYAAWFDGDGLQADILEIEEIPLPESEEGTQEGPGETAVNRRGHLLHMRVSIDGAALPRVHALRLVSSAGISNPLPFVVGSESVVLEAKTSHDTSGRAQPVRFPSVIFGRISQTGELDYYAFQPQKGQDLVFEVFSRPTGVAATAAPSIVDIYEQVESGFDARLGLYEDRGSWFDEDRVRSLGLSDESLFASIDTNPRLRHRFDQDGKYILEVASSGKLPKLGSGGPDHGYLLRIALPGTALLSGQALQIWQHLLARSDWREQTFERRLQPDRLLRLQQRSGRFDPEEKLPHLPSLQEQEPNDRADQAIEIRPSTLVEGTIDRAGDSDNFRFRVAEAGQELVFEIETPRVAPPRFNPLMVVMDQEGREVLTNVYLRVGRNPHYRKTVQPKTIHVFEKPGEYRVKIRDITYRSGGPDFQYRLLIRPRIPHLGEIEVREEAKSGKAVPIDLINLVPGVPKTLFVVTGLEEGFQSAVVVGAEGLPDTVKLLPVLKPDPEPVVPLAEALTCGRPSTFDCADEGAGEKYVPKTSRATVVLVADVNATPNRTPHGVQFKVGFFSGKGSALKVRKVPLMVLPPPAGQASEEMSP